MGEQVGAVWRGLGAGQPRTPWFWHRQLKRPFFGRFMRPWRWPADVPQDGWTHHRIESGSGSDLAAIVKTTDAVAPRGTVVCAHPMGLAAKGFWLRHGHAQALLEAGWHVVAYDFNGFGESLSASFDYPADVLAVGRWARMHFAGLPVHALCASFGAMNTLDAIGLPDFPYSRVVAEGCAPSLPMFWKAYPVAHAVLQASRLAIPKTERRLRPELGMARLGRDVRVLLVHSRADRWTPIAHGDRLAAAAPAGSHVERLILERADHTHGMRDEADVYWPAVRRFLDAP